MFTQHKYYYNNTFNKPSEIKIVKLIVITTLISFFFLPPLKFGRMGIRIDDILILLIIPLLIFYRRKVYKSSLINIMLLLLLFMLFSTWYGNIFLDVPYTIRDYNEIIRLSKPLFFAIFIYYMDCQNLKKIIFNIFYYGSYFIIFVGFFQYFDPFGVGAILSKIYTSESQIEAALYSQVRRVTLTGSGPNEGAVLASYFLLFNYFSFIYKRKGIYLLLFLGLFIDILFTSSRTVFLGVLVTLLLNIFFSSRAKIYYKLILFFLLLGIVIYILSYFSYIYDGLILALNGKNTSLLKRFVIWEEAYELFKQSMLLGWGPAKAIHTTIVDGEYFLFLRRFGIVGMFLLIVLILYPLKFTKKVKKKKDNDLNILYNTLVFLIPLALIIMLTNNFFSGYQSFLPFIVLVILIQKCYNTIRK